MVFLRGTQGCVYCFAVFFLGIDDFSCFLTDLPEGMQKGQRQLGMMALVSDLIPFLGSTKNSMYCTSGTMNRGS